MVVPGSTSGSYSDSRWLFNTDDNVEISKVVATSTVKAYCSWSSPFFLRDLAVTNITTTPLSVTAPPSRSTFIDLSLLPHSLSAGRQYSFMLSASYTATDGMHTYVYLCV